jgi:AraC-like DNA-binding protein
MKSYHRTFGSNNLVAPTLDVNDLAHAAINLTGKDLAVTAGQVFRSPDELNAHLSADLCQMLGAPERTLRAIWQEQLGMSPHRYLLLRRWHLARQALLRTETRSTTVIETAAEHGFWELGRLSAVYRALFEEMSSATLRR